MSKKPVTLTKNETMHSALKLMHDERVDTLLVTDDEKHLLGFIDVEDINDHYSPNKKIEDLINADILYVNENSIIRDTVNKILKRGYKNIPVVNDDHKIVGIVTRTALVDIIYDALTIDDSKVGD